ncbi:MAG: DUF1292 domain-containing protein [Lachnospiraceae bacterium]|nr:DUF1292 domain-containing protein [Lachnospiraceae bacterium]
MSNEFEKNVWDAFADLDDDDSTDDFEDLEDVDDMDDFEDLEDADDLEDLDDMEDLDNIITLTDENGNDVQFEFLDLLEYEGEEYVILLPLEDDDEDGAQVVILKIGEDNPDGMESYESVDDPKTLEAVYQIFKEKFKDEFNFTD